MTERNSVWRVLLLLTAAVVWGFAFSAQSIGADVIGGWTFLALRSWLGFFTLLVIILARDGIARAKFHYVRERSRADWLELAKGGLVCGFFLTFASGLQQIGIAETTAANSSFITALYVILVPVLLFAAGKKPDPKIWICCLLSVVGLYLLCMENGLRLGRGDALTLCCAFLFALQIISIGHFAGRLDGMELTCAEFLTESVIATVLMVTRESVVWSDVRLVMPSILYAGLLSSAVGYTLQTIGQKGLDPSIASIAMCMESVFGAIGGWIILHEYLNLRQITGCVLMFLAIVTSQVSLRGPKRTGSGNA